MWRSGKGNAWTHLFLLQNLALHLGLGQRCQPEGIAIIWQQLFCLQKRRTITLECGSLRKFCSTSSLYPRSMEQILIRGGVEDTRLEAKAKAKDTKKIRGQGQGQGQPFRGQTLSRPRTGMLEAKAKDQGHKAQVLSKKKKKKRSSQKFFKRSPRKNAFQKIFQPLHKILTFQKIVLSSSRGQANFRGLEASRPRPRPRTWPSRPRPRPRTSKSVLEDVLEAKDVLEDSTSDTYFVICNNNLQ